MSCKSESIFCIKDWNWLWFKLLALIIFTVCVTVVGICFICRTLLQSVSWCTITVICWHLTGTVVLLHLKPHLSHWLIFFSTHRHAPFVVSPKAVLCHLHFDIHFKISFFMSAKISSLKHKPSIYKTVFSPFNQLFFQIRSRFTNTFRNLIPDKACIYKCLLFFWTQDVAYFDNVVNQKLRFSPPQSNLLPQHLHFVISLCWKKSDVRCL